MPNKRKTVQQREQELAQRIMDDVNAGMDACFQRFEQLMERFATPTEEPAPQETPVPPVTRSKKRSADQMQQPDSPTPKVSKSHKKSKPRTATHSSSPDSDDSVEIDLGQTPWNVRRQLAQAPPRHPLGRFAEFTQSATLLPAPDRPKCKQTSADQVMGPWFGSSTNKTVRTTNPRDVQTPARGINDAWAAWHPAHKPFPSTSNTKRTLPTSTRDAGYDESVDSQVKQILATTVHNLGKGNSQPYDFPYKYILRGPEKLKASINSVSLPEHPWEIFRIIHDQKTNPTIKPCLRENPR